MGRVRAPDNTEEGRQGGRKARWEKGRKVGKGGMRERHGRGQADTKGGEEGDAQTNK